MHHMDDVTAEVDEREEYSNDFENSRSRGHLSAYGHRSEGLVNVGGSDNEGDTDRIGGTEATARTLSKLVGIQGCI